MGRRRNMVEILSYKRVRYPAGLLLSHERRMPKLYRVIFLLKKHVDYGNLYVV